MDKLEAADLVRRESILEVRVELVTASLRFGVREMRNTAKLTNVNQRRRKLMSDACGCSDDKPETAAEEAEEAVGFKTTLESAKTVTAVGPAA
ncbi:hypothetical protein AB0N33_07760 [Pseudarthrobacter oxydans]|uniref:hypothetical protein n=1 Tax=Pseudarthrobacter oxydans TaxID=1671 RepID=UPI003420FD06